MWEDYRCFPDAAVSWSTLGVWGSGGVAASTTAVDADPGDGDAGRRQAAAVHRTGVQGDDLVSMSTSSFQLPKTHNVGTITR